MKPVSLPSHRKMNNANSVAKCLAIMSLYKPDTKPFLTLLISLLLLLDVLLLMEVPKHFLLEDVGVMLCQSVPFSN